MSDAAEGSPDRLAEVLRLSEALSHRVLNAVLAEQAVPRDHATALIKAAQLLRDSEVPWPSVLEQALHEVVDYARRTRVGSKAHEGHEDQTETNPDHGSSPLRSIPLLGKLFGSGKAD